MSRKNKTRSLPDKESIETIIKFLKGVKARFDVTISNYSTSIDYIDKGQKYLKTFRGKKCFIAYRKIKKDVESHYKPYIDTRDLQYFYHDISSSFYEAKAIQIDIKKAYATALYNAGYISLDTYDYMNYISKTDRLAAVGMLASIKNEFTYVNGELKSHKIKENNLKSFFFYCVKEVQDIMNVCRMECVNDYILTWVDSIYIRYNPDAANEIRRILLYNGYSCSVTEINNLSCEVLGNKIRMSLESDGKNKMFYVPNYINLQKNYLLSLVKSINNDNNSKSRV